LIIKNGISDSAEEDATEGEGNANLIAVSFAK
jgi:hypothetical protein